MIKKVALGMATAALALSGLSAGTAQARETSDVIVPLGTCSFAHPVLAGVHPVKAGRATVQLRYSTTTRCAWGRIVNAKKNDKVWVDRTYDNGKTYTHLGATTVKSGSDTHTPSYYDGGGAKMRACAHSGGVTRCTWPWF